MNNLVSGFHQHKSWYSFFSGKGSWYLILAVLFAGILVVMPVAAGTLAFSGHAYEGYAPDTSRPLSGLQVRVYEESFRPTAYPPILSRTVMVTGTTDSSGYYSLTVTVQNDPQVSFLELTPPPDYAVTDASPVHGTLRSDGSIAFPSPVSSGTGADFWMIPAYPPVAGFSLTRVEGDTGPITYIFTDASANYPDSWSWDFGDGTRSSGKNPSHTFTTPGDRTVTLEVSNAFGSDSETKIITVSLPESPLHADFSAYPTDSEVPLTVRFTDISSGDPVRWSWDFNNDGVSDSSANNPDHSYTKSGTYSVRLDVYDPYGRSDTMIKTGLITVREQQVTPQTTVKPTTIRTTTAKTPCEFFSLPCDWIGGVLIILVVALAARVLFRHPDGADVGRPEPDQKKAEPEPKKACGPRDDPNLQSRIELEVQRGIEVPGMEYPDTSIRLETEAGIEYPEDMGGRGGDHGRDAL